ncbi:spore germination protein [Paenibacillus humicola]|uniref:spore germination protein n=1 Tax=Paenibacillus humicola TaxID=3110540 RepID=UPI00237B2E9B|nr:spore germination protein [Paenibacillus humicola]
MRFRIRKPEPPRTELPDTLSADINKNLQVFRSIYADCSDVIFRPFLISGSRQSELIHIDGLSNIEEIDRSVLAPLMQEIEAGAADIEGIFANKLTVSKLKVVQTFNECVEQISAGNPLLLIDLENRALSFGLGKWEKRAVEEPAAERVLRGPREGFTETLGVNTSLLRRKIRSPELKTLTMKVGRRTRTDVVIAYMEGIADKTLIDEVKNRLQRIDIEGVLESGYIEELIEDNPYSPFPQLLNTERVDVAASSLLEGRAVILMDGTPFVLVAPISFFSLLHSAEDYYSRFMIGTAIRWLRYFFVVLSMLLPSLYVALITFHHELVPTSLLISMARSREDIPFPALVEALIMEIIFEALREAGVRLPKQVGAAVSIVGALVIGEAAVSAGIVSSPMVMVVAITGIASFTIPRYAMGISLRMLRFPMIFLAGTLGLLGIMLGIIVIAIHLCTLRSFGVPYLSPIAPLKTRELKDVLIRAPWWSLNSRPHLTGKYDPYRQAPRQKPGPGRGEE